MNDQMLEKAISGYDVTIRCVQYELDFVSADLNVSLCLN